MEREYWQKIFRSLSPDGSLQGLWLYPNDLLLPKIGAYGLDKDLLNS